jgi:hypothetical protein
MKEEVTVPAMPTDLESMVEGREVVVVEQESMGEKSRRREGFHRE